MQGNAQRKCSGIAEEFGDASGGLNPERDVKWLTVGVGAPAALAIRQKSVDAMALWGDFQAGLENSGLQFREISAPFMKDLLGQIVIAARQLGYRLPELTGGIWQWTRLSREA